MGGPKLLSIGWPKAYNTRGRSHPRIQEREGAATASSLSDDGLNRPTDRPARWTRLVYQSQAVNPKPKGCVGIAGDEHQGKTFPCLSSALWINRRIKHER